MEKPNSIVLVNVPCVPVHAAKMSLIDIFTQKPTSSKYQRTKLIFTAQISPVPASRCPGKAWRKTAR